MSQFVSISPHGGAHDLIGGAAALWEAVIEFGPKHWSLALPLSPVEITAPGFGLVLCLPLNCYVNRKETSLLCASVSPPTVHVFRPGVLNFQCTTQMWSTAPCDPVHGVPPGFSFLAGGRVVALISCCQIPGPVGTPIWCLIPACRAGQGVVLGSRVHSLCMGCGRVQCQVPGPQDPIPICRGWQGAVPGPRDPITVHGGWEGAVPGPQGPIPVHRRVWCQTLRTQSQHAGVEAGSVRPPQPNSAHKVSCATHLTCRPKRLSISALDYEAGSVCYSFYTVPSIDPMGFLAVAAA